MHIVKGLNVVHNVELLSYFRISYSEEVSCQDWPPL